MSAKKKGARRERKTKAYLQKYGMTRAKRTEEKRRIRREKIAKNK